MFKVRLYMMEIDMEHPERADKAIRSLFKDLDDIDTSLYQMVHEETEEHNDLDYLYVKYNSDTHVRNNRVRSMSVSDILFVQEEGAAKGKYYLCMHIGWKELKMSPEDEAELNRDKRAGQQDKPEHAVKKETYFEFRFNNRGFPSWNSPFGLKTTIIYNERDKDAIYETERRPYYRIRGKRITKELAHKIIRLTDGYLYKFIYRNLDRDDNWVIRLFEEVGAKADTKAHMQYIDNLWFPEPFEAPRGWCHPDGYIGINNYVSSKNPFLEDILDDWAGLLESLTDDEAGQLDLVLVMTKQDEFLRHYLNFLDEVVCGFRVKGRSIEILGAPKARLLYKKYDNLYGEHDLTGPLRDYRDICPKERGSYGHLDSVEERGLWGSGNCSSCGHSFSWGYDCDDLIDRTTKVDKNSPMYYGYPDYNFKEGPMTVDDMWRFAVEFLREEIVNPRDDNWWKHLNRMVKS